MAEVEKKEQPKKAAGKKKGGKVTVEGEEQV